jgi:hypothetical protein
MTPKCGQLKVWHWAHRSTRSCDPWWENETPCRELLEVASIATDPEDEAATDDRPQCALATPCPCCGGRMIVIETFEAGGQPRRAPIIRIDTS